MTVMSSRTCAILTVVSLALAATAAHVGAQQSTGLTIRNERTVPVTIEIGVDTGAGCKLPKVLTATDVPAGGAYRLTTSRGFCWRRQATPGQKDGKWAAWATERKTDDRSVEVKP